MPPNRLKVTRATKKRHRRRRHRPHKHQPQHAHSQPTPPPPPERYIHHIEVSKQRANASDGNVADLSGALGWKVVSDSRRTWISGLLGWSGSAQHVHLNQVVVERDTHNVVGVGPLSSVSASYRTRWQGPWVGFDFVTLVDYNLTLFGSGEWHWASFQSNANWRYGDFFNATFRQKARAYGVKGTLGLDWNFCSCWTLGIMGDYQQWLTKKGSNHTHISRKNLPSERADMVIPVMEKSTLRRTRWSSFSVSAQLAYRF